ncbi:UNVERIFIED_CONTAM: RNA-directed DNA polymerase [Sesamum indicum]
MCMTRYGSFELLVMPFGLMNAIATICNLMNDVVYEFLDRFVVVYVNKCASPRGRYSSASTVFSLDDEGKITFPIFFQNGTLVIPFEFKIFPWYQSLHLKDSVYGIVLVSTTHRHQLLNWSFGIKRALRAKMKLGFIDETSEKPHPTDPFFEQWIRVDSMVTTWILNSISKNIVEAFMCTKSSRNLWVDLEQRYRECNGPQLYQIQREICSMS